MSGEMDVHPVRYDFDFEELKATEGYNPPDDFLIRVLPLDAAGALPGKGESKERVWYEYPSPFGKDWNLQSTQLQLQLQEERERRSLEEREERRQELEADMLQHKEEKHHQEESQRQLQDSDLLQHHEETKLQLDELALRLSLEEKKLRFDVYGNSIEDMLGQRLDAVQQRLLDAIQQRLREAIQQHYHEEIRLGMMQRCYHEDAVDAVQRQRMEENHRLDREERRLALEGVLHRLQQEKDDIYMNEIRAASECWGEAPTYSSSPARDAPEEEQQFHVEEHKVRLEMWENDDANIPRYRLFNCEANTQELLLGFPLKIPYYIYAGRCNLNLEGYELRYADLFPTSTAGAIRGCARPPTKVTISTWTSGVS